MEVKVRRGKEKDGSTKFIDKNIDAHRINRKANYKLDIVTQMFEKVLGNKLVDVKSELLYREFTVKGFKKLTKFSIDYRSYENRFWSFIFNFDVSAEITLSEDDQYEETESCLFLEKAKGKMSIKDVEWRSSSLMLDPDKETIYLKKLSHKLIKQRMLDLDMINGEISFNPKTRTWTTSFRSTIGSTTWILIPPVTQLITPREDECIKILEYLDMTLAAVQSKEMREYIKKKAKENEDY